MSRICVLGLGNLLWADEGFGVRLAERLFPLYDGIDGVTVLDGGTQGLALLPYIQDAERLLILDAIDFGMAPGTLAVFRDQQVPAYLTAKKLSLHQTGFAEVLAVMRLMGNEPAEIVLIGVQPVCLDDYGGSLSTLVKQQLPAASEQAIAILRQWGVSAQPHDTRAAPSHTINHQSVNHHSIHHHSLEISRYESQRPDSASACRFGDARVLARQEH